MIRNNFCTGRNLLFAGLFLTAVILLGIIGDIQTVYYYIFDPVLNEAFTADAGDKSESAYIANFPGKDTFIDANGLMANLLGQQEMNGIVKLNNGYLTDVHPQISDETLQEEAAAVSHVNEVLAEYDIPFLYVAAPLKAADTAQYPLSDELPAGVSDYGNQNLDTFLSFLTESGVQVLDIRACMETDGLDPYDYFYVTDHHWTTEGGFYAYTKLAERLEEMMGVLISDQVKASEQYTRTNYPDAHLGSNARRTGKLYAGTDDFVLLTPSFDTLLTNRVSGETGRFDEVLLNMDALEKTDLSVSLYDQVFLHALEQYHNELAENDKKILLICDSFGAAMNPYLVLSFEDMQCMSAYAPGLLTRAYLEQEQPDAVILMQYSGLNLGEASSFEFGL